MPQAHDWASCTQGCGLRFPAPVDQRPRLRCPGCDGPLTWSDDDRAHGGAGVAHDDDHLVPGPPPPTVIEVAAVLDNVRSALNVGAMLRTADAMAVGHVHLAGITPAGDHPQVDKTALGAQETVAWSHHPDGLAVVTGLRANGWEVWAMEAGVGAQTLAAACRTLHGRWFRPDEVARIALVVGHEVAGVDPAILAVADQRVQIPMRGAKRSLNVATAFGIAAHAVTTPA